ncbi:syntaxin-22-like isoform X1 [Bidens hawaiensis]|uniref:syntaxin-22-like isoform X1 n=1 Tax=Bidens hawaiensis TaxID=980011 RepID=UPI004049C0CF
MSFQDIEAGRPLNSRRNNNVLRKQDPTQAVASGIFQINTAVATFQRLVNSLGSPKDTPELREKLHKTRLHIGQLVKDTSDKLKQASETDHTAGVSASKKITDAKLAKDFQTVLKEYQKAQRLSAERETAYTPFVPQSSLPSRDPASEADGSQEQQVLLVNSKRQEVLLLENEIAFNEAIIEERDQGIEEIQNQIGEVNEIFKDLAVLVHEQGTMIGMFIFNFSFYLYVYKMVVHYIIYTSVTCFQMILGPTLKVHMLLQHRQNLILQKHQRLKDLLSFGDYGNCDSHCGHSSSGLTRTRAV